MITFLLAQIKFVYQVICIILRKRHSVFQSNDKNNRFGHFTHKFLYEMEWAELVYLWIGYNCFIQNFHHEDVFSIDLANKG